MPATSASRFSFLSSPMSALSRLTQSPAQPASGGGGGDSGDELSNLNLDAALFPSASPSDRDAFSPAAFKNLQTNAAGLLSKFQAAHRRQTAELRDLRWERTAQADELDEAQTRAALLKMQLEEMARKAEEQEAAMKQLAEELVAEKRGRVEDRIAREKGLAAMSGLAGLTTVSEGSTVSEDLGVEDDQRLKKWRKSIDTDEESVEDASMFSRSRSPTIAPSVFEGSVAGADTSAQAPPLPLKVVGFGPPGGAPKARPGQQMSMFQKVLKGISGDPTAAAGGGRDSDETFEGPGGRRGCRNCKGQDASVAWDTVSLLRDENRGLKQRVAQLETSVESALDAVNGVGL